MAKYITRAQYNKLCDARFFDGVDAFNALLEEMTDIEARPYIGYSYHDAAGDYVGDSGCAEVDDLLKAAYVEVADG